MGGASRAILLRSPVICRLSSRKRRGGVGGCGDRGEGGARGDVLRGCGARGPPRRQCLRDARGGRSLGGAVQSFAACGSSAAVPASERASRSRRIPGALPASQTPRSCALFPSSLGHSLLRGLEALSVGPIPARFLLLPVEAPEMSFFISLEMNQVICAGPTDEAGEEGQADSELAHGAGGWGLRVGGAERCGIPGVQESASRRSRCSLWTRSRRRADPALQALPWLSGRVSGQRRVAGRLG